MFLNLTKKKRQSTKQKTNKMDDNKKNPTTKGRILFKCLKKTNCYKRILNENLKVFCRTFQRSCSYWLVSASSFINLHLRENNYARAYIICSNQQNLILYEGSGMFPVFPDGAFYKDLVQLDWLIMWVACGLHSTFSVRRTISQLSWSLWLFL